MNLCVSIYEEEAAEARDEHAAECEALYDKAREQARVLTQTLRSLESLEATPPVQRIDGKAYGMDWEDLIGSTEFITDGDYSHCWGENAA